MLKGLAHNYQTGELEVWNNKLGKMCNKDKYFEWDGMHSFQDSRNNLIMECKLPTTIQERLLPASSFYSVASTFWKL